MVATRSSQVQDQERQRCSLSSLRINYFISNNFKNNRMDPITPDSEKINLHTKHGKKIYESCTKELSVVFDAVARKHHSFLMALKKAADERCWREICLAPVSVGNGNPPIFYNLLVQPGKISFKDLSD
jgi:hypothetical protein